MNSDLANLALRNKPLNILLRTFGFPETSADIQMLLNAQSIASYLNIAEPYQLKCQSQIEDTRYYEQIIFEDKVIPTRRDSWHDFFNAVIWSLFPLTKAYLNEQHIEQINTFGLSPRTHVRNQITLFDECGVVIFTQDKDFKSALENHNWDYGFNSPFVDWHNKTHCFIFGHANYEMLLQPFIGLTAKALVIEVDEQIVAGRDNFSSLCRFVDKVLVNHLNTHHVLTQKKPFKPLPLLGVPGWHLGKQDAAFYNNTQYFMPKRSFTPK